MDNESKFHTKMLVTHMQSHGIQIYPGSGKKPWDREEDGYPPRSHDCMPDETEFSEVFEDAQEGLEGREKNRRKRRSMAMWKLLWITNGGLGRSMRRRKLLTGSPKSCEQSSKPKGGGHRTTIWEKS